MSRPVSRPALLASRAIFIFSLVAAAPAFAYAADQAALAPAAPVPAAPLAAAEAAPAPAARPPRLLGQPSPASGLGVTTALAALALLSLGAVAWWRRRRWPAELAAASLEVVAHASLGGRARVLWLRTVGQGAARNVVVTVTPQAVQVLDRWPDAVEPVPATTPAPESAQVLRARRPGRGRTLPAIFTTVRAANAAAAATPPSDDPRNDALGSNDPRSDQPASAPTPAERARPRWDTATHRVIEDRARHLEAAFTGESTFEGIPDDLAADLAADLPLLPDEPGAAKVAARASAELLARAWRRTISRQPMEATNASALPPASGAPGAPGAPAAPGADESAARRAERGGPATYEAATRTARGSIGHDASGPRAPAAAKLARRPLVRAELRAKRPANARCRLLFRRRGEGEPQ